MDENKYFSKASSFINRENEKEYLMKYLHASPESMLFVYWPKSSWKSTLMKKVVENLDTKVYSVNFMDLRWVLIVNFQSFLETFFPKNLVWKVKDIVDGVTLNMWFFWLWLEDEKIFKQNPFKVMEDKLRAAVKRWKKPVIILDEIQLLKWIFINWERYLMSELFNFFIRITKVEHLAHIVCLTSESTFIDEIYNDAKLKNTSDFYMLEHLEKDDVYKWLKDEWLVKKDIENIWKNLWGSPQEIWNVLVKFKNWMKLKGAIDEKIQVEIWRTDDMVSRFDKLEKKLFFEVTKEIIKKWKFVKPQWEWKYLDLITQLVQKDIWFYDSITWTVTANSESVRQAFKKFKC